MKSMKKLVLAGLILLASVVVLVGCKMEPEGQQGPKVYEFTSEPRILSDYSRLNNTDSKWTYVAFGDWPQTIKAKDVEVTADESKKKEMGMFTAYLGSDGNYYVEAEERAYGSGSEYKYSDETPVGQNGASKKWFKVEPIVWRVLTEDYKVPGENEEPQSTGQALLLAENILTGGKWADSKNNYKESNIRKWLNGNRSDAVESDYDGDAGFLQTAFTEEARDQIADTKVDNSASSTNPDRNATLWNSGENPYASETKTKDKIFLLSEQEATMSDYDFDKYNAGGAGNTRIRVPTDYAKATGAFQPDTDGYGGWWWLRSPDCDYDFYARIISSDGYANYYNNVLKASGGVVPALSISLQ